MATTLPFSPTAGPQPTSRAQSYAQLVRLPNLPSALADVCLGAFAALQTAPLRSIALPWLLLMLASACLYCSGMVFNDLFDFDLDRRERPERPIPSGRVSRKAAGILGWVLMAGGLLFALVAGLALGRDVKPPILALCLIAAIFVYDGWLKRTPLGPLAMGLCRFLNVLMAVSMSGSLWWPGGAHLAFVVGLYIVGVTWFARTETSVSRQWSLVGAFGVMLFALLLALSLPLDGKTEQCSPLFPYLIVILGFVVGLPACRAIALPSASRVQTAVKRSLMALILLDATLATALAGTVGLVILVLMLPSLYLNRRLWLYAT